MALTTDREKVAHLLRRFGLGASEAEVDYYVQGGLRQAIDRLLNFEDVDEGFDLPLLALASKNGNVNMRIAQAWWMLRLCVTRRPLQEKLTLFWHDHFATSAQKVDPVAAMVAHIQTLRDGCAGRFKDLLLSVSQDPAMIYWLDNQLNVKGKPNENFGREIMELFTVGIGHYTEKDVQEVARAFTGWGYGVGPRKRETDKAPARGAAFLFRDDKHDTGQKTVLGKTGAFDGRDVVMLLSEQPETAREITLKFWEWFVYPKPAPELINRLSDRFRESGLNIKFLVRSIIESPEFFSERAERKIIKNPIDFCVATCRQLGVGQSIVEAVASGDEAAKIRAIGPAGALLQATKSMGMELLYPPDVAGWEGGSSWISSATMLERIKWSERLFARTLPRGVAGIRYPAGTLFGGTITPLAATQAILKLFDAQLPPEKAEQVVTAVSVVAGGNVTSQNAPSVAQAACKLIFGSPEFQFC